MAFLNGPYQQGERQWYRSWGEARIARLLDQNGVPYRYEHPVAVVDRGKTRVWYPDFYLQGLGILIEYYGRLDDPQYAEGMARKQKVYEQNGMTALALTPESVRDGSPIRLLDQIEEILSDRLMAFRNVRGQHSCGTRSTGSR